MKGHHLIFAACFSAACNNAAITSSATPDRAESDTINYALNEDSVKLQLNNITSPEGFYQVMLPCTNCKGIEHTVLFNRDMSYRLEEKVAGSEAPPTRKEGAWKPVNGAIWLYYDSSVAARYTWQGDTLQYTDLKSGVHIPLRNVHSALENTNWQNNENPGLEFYGAGTEPFWNIFIDDQKRIVLSLADTAQKIAFKPAKPVRFADSVVYQSRNGASKLRVVIYNRFGSDGMRDNIYPNEVQVRYNDTLYKGGGVLYR